MAYFSDDVEKIVPVMQKIDIRRLCSNSWLLKTAVNV